MKSVRYVSLRTAVTDILLRPFSERVVRKHSDSPYILLSAKRMYAGMNKNLHELLTSRSWA